MPPQWKLPSGVTRGQWDYFHSRSVAEEYDRYFAGHSLFAYDELLVTELLARHPAGTDARVVDLGCGTGRMLIALARQGFRGLAVDLSEWMLREVRRKAEEERLPIDTVKANLVELDGIRDAAIDHAVCMFSTLGMIRGRAARRQALLHVHRILRPGGMFVLHVHNYLYNLRDPAGPWWLLTNWLQSLWRRDLERGDKYYAYRGVANMFLHVFTRGEIVADLQSAGLVVRQVIPLEAARRRPLRQAWFASSWRANGWILIAARPR